MIVRTSMYKVQENEIGIAVSHYHSKLGPMFLATQFNFDLFDRITQYNILQDSISSALLLIIPSNIKELAIDLADISDDIVEKLSQGAYINQCLKAWGTLINDIHGPVSFERNNSELEEIPDESLN
ncbi:MAG: hypothetical protein ACTSPA_13225 [Promethearchaeota archaeon]